MKTKKNVDNLKYCEGCKNKNKNRFNMSKKVH